MDAHVVPPGAGERITERAERTVALLADRDELSVTESRYEPGERGPDPHFHRRHCDSFFVLAGALVFEIAGERLDAPAGTFVLVPPEVEHTFENRTDTPVRILIVHAPAGFDLRLRSP